MVRKGSWSKRSEDNFEILNRLEGWKIVSFFGRINSIRGGVFVAVKDNIPSRVRRDFVSLSIENIIECAAVEINYEKTSTVVVALYRPPSGAFSGFFDQVEKILNLVSKDSKQKHVIICGDLNIDALSDSAQKTELFSLLDSFGLFSHVNEPTRVTERSETCIDYIITNQEGSETRVVDFGLSDHNAQLLKLNLTDKVKNSSKSSSQLKRVFSERNKINFREVLSTIDWNNVFNVKDEIDVTFDNFLRILLLNFEENFPKKLVKATNCKKPWLTKGIKKSLDKKQEMSKIVKSSSDPIFISYYKSYESSV